MFSRSAHIYDLLYDQKDYAAEASTVHELVEARRPGARDLLDIACGTGRHLEQFQKWYAVEGIDLDGELLAAARRRLPGVALHEADMLTFELGRTFDVVTCLFNSIGYLMTLEEVTRAVANMARHLAPDGVLVVEPWMTPETFVPRFPGRLLTYEDENMQVVRMSVGRVEGRTSVIDFDYLVAHPGHIEHMTESHRMGLFTTEEYRQAFELAALSPEFDAHGLIGRGLWVAQRTSS